MGTVSAIQLPFFTGIGLSNTNVGFEPKYLSSSNVSDWLISRWSSRVFWVVPRRRTEIRAVDDVPEVVRKNLISSAVGFASRTVKAIRCPSRRM